MKKTLHVLPQIKTELEFLKKHFGVRSESEVVELLIRLYYQTDQFPRDFLTILLEFRNGKERVQTEAVKVGPILPAKGKP